MTERDIEIVEVSPSDGLQNDKVTFSTEAKAKLIELAVAAGLRRLEATSLSTRNGCRRWRTPTS